MRASDTLNKGSTRGTLHSFFYKVARGDSPASSSWNSSRRENVKNRHSMLLSVHGRARAAYWGECEEIGSQQACMYLF